MKKLKRWTALALSGLLLLSLAACGPAGDTSQQGGGSSGGGSSGQGTSGGGSGEGRYVETDITPPGIGENNFVSFLKADGTLVCYTQDLTKQYTSTDGGATWQEGDGPAATADLDGRVQNSALLPDGGLLASLADDNGNLTGLVKIAPDGTVAPFSIPVLDTAIATGKTTYISMLKVLSDSRLFMHFASGDFGGFAADTPEDMDGGEGDNSTGEDGSEGPAENEADPGNNSIGADNAGGGDGDDADASGGGSKMFSAGEQTDFAGMIDLATGAVVAEYPDWFGIDVAADGDTLYLLDYDGNVLAKSLADGAAIKAGEGKVPVAELSFQMAMASGPDGLYVLNNKRLQKLATGGEAETLMDGSAYSFSDANSSPQALHPLQDGSIVVNLMRQEGNRLYRYAWDENATIDPAKTLKVWSLHENYLVRAAISEMRKKHPDVLIEYEVAIGEESGVTAEDAIKTLNTRLLNGDGPDVLLLDGTPAENYAARGMLAELSALVDTSDMFENIAAPFRAENGTFYLPTNVKIPVLLGNEDALASANTLEALTQMIQQGSDLPQQGEVDDVFASLPENERPVLAPGDLEELFNLLWNSSSGSVIAQGQLDSGALNQMLAALLAISDKYGLGAEGGGASTGAMAMMSTGGAAATVTGAVLAYASQRARLGGYTADDLQLLQMMMEPPGTELAAFPGLSDGGFVPDSLVGINADSEKTELAAQFINTLLGDTVQGTRSGRGFPVTHAGIQKQISAINDIMQENQQQSFAFDYAPLMALAQMPQMTDAVVKDMVWTVAQSLCKGDTDLEGAVKQLEQNLKNYLAERQ